MSKILLPVLLLVGCIGAQQAADSSTIDANTAEHQIRTVLHDQVEAWNRGDLEGYMAGYWNSPELTFFSNATETKGWVPTLARYRARYQAGGRSMGKVDFPELRVTVLSSDAAFAEGKWHLAMPNGAEPQGMFTLVLRRFPEGWRIVHDHSSGE